MFTHIMIKPHSFGPIRVSDPSPSNSGIPGQEMAVLCAELRVVASAPSPKAGDASGPGLFPGAVAEWKDYQFPKRRLSPASEFWLMLLPLPRCLRAAQKITRCEWSPPVCPHPLSKMNCQLRHPDWARWWGAGNGGNNLPEMLIFLMSSFSFIILRESKDKGHSFF